jgi:uncharacterized protein
MIFKTPPDTPLADNITFVVTDDCNLRCKYCYETKKKENDMTIATAIKGADYFFDTWKHRYNKVIFDFVGGEPFVRMDLLNAVIPYILEKFRNQTEWESLIFGFSTNGTRFNDPEVRQFIEKYHDYLSVGVSLDGCKTIHDINRNNSFDELMNWFPYWRNQFPNGSTKSTLNHEAIPYVFESVKFLESTCLDNIFMNTVYEDVWKEGDDKLFEEQLIKAADYILDNKLYKYKHCSLFDIFLVNKIKMENNHNWCGCGSCMIALDYQGNLYPCLRFKTLSKMEPLAIGNIFVDNGKLDYKKLLPFYFCHNTRNTPDCDNCEANASCPNCTAFCYDETGSIFDRTDYMCKMHQARYRANVYYWNKMCEIENVTLDELQNQRFVGKDHQDEENIEPPRTNCTVCSDSIPDLNNIKTHDVVSRYDR